MPYKVGREKIAYNDRRKQVIKKLGSKCLRCGFNDERALQIDHINNDGHSERRKNIGGSNFMLLVLKDNGSKYQLLCSNCNWIKRYEAIDLLKAKMEGDTNHGF